MGSSSSVPTTPDPVHDPANTLDIMNPEAENDHEGIQTYRWAVITYSTYIMVTMVTVAVITYCLGPWCKARAKWWLSKRQSRADNTTSLQGPTEV